MDDPLLPRENSGLIPSYYLTTGVLYPIVRIWKKNDFPMEQSLTITLIVTGEKE